MCEVWCSQDQLYLSWHLWSHHSFLRNFDHLLKLFDITSTRVSALRHLVGRTLCANSRFLSRGVSVRTERLKLNLACETIDPNSLPHDLAICNDRIVEVSMTIK